MTEITPALGLSAYLLGRRIAGQRRKREPVAWLYGEEKLRLPPLPEWDRTTHPYYFISRYKSNGRTFLHCIDSFEYTQYGGSSGVGWGILYPESSLEAELENGVWGSFYNPKIFRSRYMDEIIWANFELLNEDGSVYLYASKPDPIPVYE